MQTRAGAQADGDPPVASAAPARRAPVRNIAPVELDALRVAGRKDIVPDAVTQAEIAAAAVSRVLGSYKVCLSAAGDVSRVDVLRSTGFRAFDETIASRIRTWRYRGYTAADGAPAPVCSAITIVYRQVGAPPAPDRGAPATDSPSAARSSTTPDAAQFSPRPLELASPGHFLPQHPVRWLFSLDVGGMGFHPDAAAAQKIGTSAFELGGTLGLKLYDVLSFSGSFAGGAVSDEGGFNEVVVPVNGGAERAARSGLTLARASFAITAHTPYLALMPTHNGYLGGSLFAGIGWSRLSGNRSIANCEDCRSEDLELTGGTFWRIGGELAIPTASSQRWGITGSYQGYGASSALSGELLLGFAYWR